jgi:hypothetical protein
VRGPLAILLGVAGVVALMALVGSAGGSGEPERDCKTARPLRAATLAESLAPRYTRLAIERKTLEEIFAPLAKDLPAVVAYEGQLLLRKRKPVAYMLVMNSSGEELGAEEVYSGFSEPEGGPTRELPFGGKTGRIRRVVGGFSSIGAHGGCAAVTVGSESESAVVDISRRLALP